MLRRSFVAALAASLTILAACGGDNNPTGVDGTVTGTYTLRTVNNQALPFTLLQVGSDRVEVTGSTLTLNTDMSFTEVTNFRITENGVVTPENGATVGTYTRAGNLVTFTDDSDPPSTYTATWDGDRQLTLSASGITLVYRK